MELAPCIGGGGHLAIQVARDIAADKRSAYPRKRTRNAKLRVKRLREEHGSAVATGQTSLAFKPWLRSLKSLDFVDPTGKLPHTSSLVEKIRGRKR
jgi:hypothetical protein